MRITKDDPKLIDFVFDELAPHERQAVEAAIEQDDEVRAAVAEIRAAVQASAETFEQEPALALTDDQRREIELAADTPARANVSRRRKRKQRPVWVQVCRGLAYAASIVILVGLVVVPRLVGRTERARIARTQGSSQIIVGEVSLPRGMASGQDLNNPAGSPVSAAKRLSAQRMLSWGHVIMVDGEFAGRYGDFGATLEPSPGIPDDPSLVYWPGHNTEQYDNIVENPFLTVVQNPLSTFSIDVDTASYSNMRRFLTQGAMPPPDSVRIEELVNYFSYDYEPPRGEDPFSANVEVATCPWNVDHRLVRIGLKGWEIDDMDRPASNLVFLLDVSGSMRPVNKLPLLKKAMRMLVSKLDERDRVAIAVYAGASGLVLPSTSADNKETILGALDQLESGGSTNGGAGIRLAYDVATQNFIEGGINRVILATDGDFNVGTTNDGDLVRLIEEKAKTGVFLSVLGFGMGNLKDSKLEKLADKGNGNYAYIDTLGEARKVLVEEMGSTLITIAKDVKIQVEFNPAEVAGYRLIGYENRMLRAEDFNDDTKDAGEIGAGHTVTAFYEIVPAGMPVDTPSVDPLRYQQQTAMTDTAFTGEIMTLKLRYKQPDGDTSKLLEFRVVDSGAGLYSATADFKFASSVAAFGMILRGSEHKGAATFDTVLELAEEGLGADAHGYRREFIDLVRKAKSIGLVEE